MSVSSYCKDFSSYSTKDNYRTDECGLYARRKIESQLKNPLLTIFNKLKETKTFTMFRKNHISIEQKNELLDKSDNSFKITNEKSHLATELVIEIQIVYKDKYDYFYFLNNIFLKIKQSTELLSMSIFDIYNIMRMYPELFSKCMKVRKVSSYYEINIIIPINDILNLNFFVLGSKNPLYIDIDWKILLTCDNVLSINNNIDYTGIILNNIEYDRFEMCAKNYVVNRFGKTKMKINKKNKVNINNNVIIDNILVIGNHNFKYGLHKLEKVLLHDNDFVVDLAEIHSSHNSMYKKCGYEKANDIFLSGFYYFSDNVCETIVNKLLPSNNRYIEPQTKTFCKDDIDIEVDCIIRYQSTYFYSNEFSYFNYEFDVDIKASLFTEYSNALINGCCELNKIIENVKENTNTYPLYYDKTKNVYYEGYWYSENMLNKEYPIPIIDLSTGSEDEKFLKKLELHMKENKNITKTCLGSSPCRLCNNSCNGNSEYEIHYEDKKIIFPSGLLHYYKDHNVKPSKEFYEAIINL